MITDSKIFQAGPETANYGRLMGSLIPFSAIIHGGI
jgi:hypothetical protein